LRTVAAGVELLGRVEEGLVSILGEIALRSYVTLLPKRSNGKSSSGASYGEWQYETSAKTFSFFPGFNFEGKRVLDLGCGLGGRALWLAANGAREVVGIDINSGEIEEAKRLAAERYPTLTNVSFVACKEDERLGELGDFDFVVSVDSMEHVVSPLKIVRLAREYLKPGGKMFFTTIGWYHHDGAHMGIPFATVFFSDETIINVTRWQLRRPNYQPTMWDSDPPTARWEGVYDLRDRPGEYLNKITIRALRKLIRYAPFRRGRIVVVGYQNRFRVLSFLSHIPVLNEVLHSRVVGILEK
jgi:2-polyprenyl-3-methyl-5-hydroxy-6-metoxy-1,4-benzoquinol methylase